MYVIAISALAGDLADAAPPLGALLGVAAYDVRTRIGGVLPAIVAQLASAEDARRALDGVRALGHRALLCDTREVVATREMVAMHRFHLDETTLFANDAGADRVPLDDIGALIVATTRSSVVRATVEKELSSAGARPPVALEREHETRERIDEHALYLFFHDGHGGTPRRPWVLHEGSAQYLSLGARMRPTRHDNFLVTVALLRERAPRARFDDRFSVRPRAGAHEIRVRGHDRATSAMADAGVDLAVHLVARELLTRTSGPYR